MSRRALKLLLLVILTAVPLSAAERDRQSDVPRRDRPFATSRYDRLRTARVTPGATSRAMITRQAAEHYNAVMLSDATEWDFEQNRWVQPSEEEIAEQLALAREHGMSVFLLLPAVVPIPIYLPAAADGAARRRSFRPLAATATRPSAVDYTLAYTEPDQLRARLGLWSRHDRGEIIGVMFMPDDVFLLDIPAGIQSEWFAIARTVAPWLPVLAVAGEFGLSERANRRAWAPATFDHLLWLNYPYNLGWTWGRGLDHHKSADPDADLRQYEEDYAAAMQERWFRDLAPGQLIIPVIQTFYYPTESAGAIPRPADLELQCRLIHEVVQRTFGQHDNFSIGYFYAGGGEAKDPFPHPKGIYDVPSWPGIIAANNRRLRENLRADD